MYDSAYLTLLLDGPLQSWGFASRFQRRTTGMHPTNASLYAVCAAVTCSLGYIPSLGFVHDAGTLPFIYDVADLYKEVTSFPAAFQAIQHDPQDQGELARTFLKQKIEEQRLLQRIPKELEELLE